MKIGQKICSSEEPKKPLLRKSIKKEGLKKRRGGGGGSMEERMKEAAKLSGVFRGEKGGKVKGDLGGRGSKGGGGLWVGITSLRGR